MDDAGRANDQIRGDVERVTYFNEDTGFAVLRVAVKGRRELVTVTGRAVAVRAGEAVEADGRWVEDRQFGRQFKAESMKFTAPHSKEGIVRFLSSGVIEGVGPKLAARIVDKFGGEVFEVMDHTSRRLEEVEGVGMKKRKEIKAAWDRQRTVREIMIFLHSHGISAARARRIFQTYGDESRKVLEETPYRLAEDIFGIGFRTADALAMRLGLDRVSPQRIEAGVLHALKEASGKGHAALPEPVLVAEAARLLEADEAVVAGVLPAMLERGAMVREDPGGSGPLIYLPGLRLAEAGIARQLRRRIGALPVPADFARRLSKIEEAGGMALAEGQRAALELVAGNRVAVITGGPGVGKTTVLRCWLQWMQAEQLRCVLAAPTGRAARRLAEAAGREASTLHRLLQSQPGEGFARRRSAPLEGDCFVVDEVSMVDLPLMAAFLDAVPEGARILFVGDADQLPSVGPGTVLADLISWKKMPVARLTEVFRQAAKSRIVSAAHEIRRGMVPDLAPKEGSDCLFLKRDDAAAALVTLVHLVRDRIGAGLGVDPLEDVQVLTPMNRGALGTSALNPVLRDALNPPDEFKQEIERFGTLYRRGDKVIQLRNNYDKSVFNGDIGRIAAIDAEPARVWVRFDDKRLVDYDPGELDELRLAYAITVHKSQGSEFPVVVVPLVNQHFVMLRRNLLYTALTRGRRQVVLLGEAKALELAVRRADDEKRFGGLGARLNDSV